MKTVFLTSVIAAAFWTSVANAGSMPNQPIPTVSGKLANSAVSFEAANRKGSKRVGGTGRSGKGSRYVGGR